MSKRLKFLSLGFDLWSSLVAGRTSEILYLPNWDLLGLVAGDNVRPLRVFPLA